MTFDEKFANDQSQRNARDNDAFLNAIKTYIASMQANYEMTFDEQFVTTLSNDVFSIAFDEICERIEQKYA